MTGGGPRLPFVLGGGPAAADSRWRLGGEDPRAVFRSRGTSVRVEAGGRVRASRGDPFDALRQFLRRFLPGGRRARVPSAVACFSYDLGRRIERLPRRAADDASFPDCHVAVYDRMRADDTLPPGRPGAGPFRAVPLAPNMSREAYVRAVRRAIRYIRDGDIFQANLARRFSARFTGDIAEFAARLRALSPAPYSAWLDLGGGRHVISASPELFLRVEGRRVETRPIKGTRPRGRNSAEDARNRRELEASGKEKAELAMIVDMERNDLGRVCRTGSVKVTEERAIEEYPQVFHGVATVAGVLRDGVDHADLLRATFPGGSITGAPKVRAMEIIEELEPTRRSVYCGAIGWLARDAMELSMAIRTVLVDGDVMTWQAGSGITAESDARAEERETRAKAAGIERALGRAPSGRMGRR